MKDQSTSKFLFFCQLILLPRTMAMEEDSFMWRTFRLNAKEKVHICGNIVHFVNRIVHLEKIEAKNFVCGEKKENSRFELPTLGDIVVWYIWNFRWQDGGVESGGASSWGEDLELELDQPSIPALNPLKPFNPNPNPPETNFRTFFMAKMFLWKRINFFIFSYKPHYLIL